MAITRYKFHKLCSKCTAFKEFDTSYISSYQLRGYCYQLKAWLTEDKNVLENKCYNLQNTNGD